MAKKTYKKKTTARRAARGRSVYKVKGGYRISSGRRRRRKRTTRAKRRRRRSWP